MAIETDPFLAKIQAKIAAWQAVADSYRAALALEQSGGDADMPVRSSKAPIELPVGAFRGMTIVEAVKLYLQSVRRKQTVQEIADGLRAGGLETSAADFGPTLRGVLHRMKKNGELLRFKDGWDLAEAHSPALRNRLSKENGTKAKPKAAKVPKAKPSKPKTAAGPKGPSLDSRVVAFLASRPMDWFTPNQVADALSETNPTAMSLAFARLTRYGKVARREDGRYAAPQPS